MTLVTAKKSIENNYNMYEKYEKQLSYYLNKKNVISKFKSGTTWKDTMKEIEGKYYKIKPMPQIMKKIILINLFVLN